MNTLQVQRALKARGFDPGPLDGIRGRRTIAALKAFQAATGLAVSGTADAATIAALAGRALPTSPGEAMPWMLEARRLVGVKETPGPKNNPQIMGWAERLGIWYPSDETPWCGLGVGHCIASQLPEEPLPVNVLLARNWSGFGIACLAQVGAVMVFWRISPKSGKGHVGFYWAEDDVAYHVLGFNQSDAVTIARMPRDRFLAARWPRTAPPPAGGRRKTGYSAGALSTNEA